MKKRENAQICIDWQKEHVGHLIKTNEWQTHRLHSNNQGVDVKREWDDGVAV